MILIWNLDLKIVPRLRFKTGRLTHLQNLVTDTNREIRELEQGKTCKYLGIEESEGIQHPQMKERLKQEYSRRLRTVLKSELKARNKITAIGALLYFKFQFSDGSAAAWAARQMLRSYNPLQ